LKEICQKAIEKYSPYNISNNNEIRPFRDLIVKETNFLPEKTSVSKRMYIIVNDYDYFYCKTCHQKMIDKKEFCSGMCKSYEKRVIQKKETRLRKQQQKNEKQNQFDMLIKDYDYVECAICGYKAIELTGHINQIHKMDCSNYKTKYNAEVVCGKKKERVQGENNPAYQHNGKFSKHSKNFIHGYDEEWHENFKKEQSERIKNNPVAKEKNAFCREHYETEGEYRKAQTRDLDWFQSKYGEEEGEIRWKAKTEKWLNTLNSKSDEEKSEINKKKIWKKGMISDLEKEIVEKIRISIPEIQHQFQVRNGTKWFVYDVFYNNKIIEINGDYWHANPLKYKKDDFNSMMKMTSETIWKKDEIKKEWAIQHGYEVLTIWEQEFKTNPNETIQKCINYLMV